MSEGARASVAVIILYYVFTFSSWDFFSKLFNSVNNWLSDLGNSSSRARLYNLGCILTGIALFPFFIGLYKRYTNEKWRKISLIFSQAIGCSAAFALIMIGVFSENSGSLHDTWSSIFFLLNFLVLVLVGATFYTHPRYIKAIDYYGFTVAAINFGLIFVPNTPLLEWFSFHSPRIRWFDRIQHDENGPSLAASCLFSTRSDENR